jgi:hypothetical protein
MERNETYLYIFAFIVHCPCPCPSSTIPVIGGTRNSSSSRNSSKYDAYFLFRFEFRSMSSVCPANHGDSGRWTVDMDSGQWGCKIKWHVPPMCAHLLYGHTYRLHHVFTPNFARRPQFTCRICGRQGRRRAKALA